MPAPPPLLSGLIASDCAVALGVVANADFKSVITCVFFVMFISPFLL
jgi:hypothetical protein